MVTARLAIGSVSTLALGALLLGSAPYWLGRGAGVSHASPWGAVSALGSVSSAPSTTDGERAQLLKLAALKSGAETAAVVPAVATPAAPPPDPVPAVQPVAQPDTVAASVAAVADQPAPAPATVDAPTVVASAEAPTAADVAQDDAGKGDRININTASSSVLDHLPGAGRIGHTIVSHRPYKNIKELVSRRILRTSDFQKIQSRISID